MFIIPLKEMTGMKNLALFVDIKFEDQMLPRIAYSWSWGFISCFLDRLVIFVHCVQYSVKCDRGSRSIKAVISTQRNVGDFDRRSSLCR
jgi:hypothetical protein